MERQISRRKRIFSLEPDTNPSAIFETKYLSYLVPALKRINPTKPTSEINGGDQTEFAKTVKHEVDMALALSADQEFAWSRFLKQKLRYRSSPDPSMGDSTHNSLNSDEKMICKTKKHEEDDEEINGRLMELRQLLPGGDEMDVEEMLSEVGSYIACLELQTVVLKSLVG